MIVNELANEVGVPAHVVRYYTRIGLLKPQRNPENGYKLFRSDDVRTLRFIRQAKELGFTLNEISVFLEKIAEGDSPCPNVRRLLEEHIAQNQKEIQSLQALQARMEGALNRWQQMSDGQPNAEIMCPLIESQCH